jgi:hypothetical protein
MMTGYDTGARIDSGARELNLLGIGTEPILGAGVHGNDGNVGAKPERATSDCMVRMSMADAVVDILMIAVGLVEGVSEESKRKPLRSSFILIMVPACAASRSGGTHGLDAVFI